MWLKRNAGQRTIDWLARLGQPRGGLLLYIIPLVVIQLVLRPYFPDYGDWADFVTMLAFIVYGYVLYADERFAHAIRRDWKLLTDSIVVAKPGKGMAANRGWPLPGPSSKCTAAR